MKKKSSSKHLVIILAILVVVALGLLIYKFIINKPETQIAMNNNAIDDSQQVVIEKPKEVEIFKGNDRPIAIMIDNHDDARPQVGLNKAYIVYEIVVEGGYTRMMPVFKGVDIDEIGPVRSARHYFLDYALENDAIYIHYGGSPQALSDIDKLDVTAINGIYQSTSSFWRVSGKASPHDVITSTNKILSIAKDKKYRTTSDKNSVLNYTTNEVTLEGEMDAIDVYIPFSTSQNVSFKYDSDKKVYVKYANKKKQSDWRTKEDITTKNIIITFAENYTLNDISGKGRQGLNNVKTLDGYYITNGKAIKINCEKSSRNSQTIYKDLSGNEINVNDGNTYIGICPLNAKVTIEGLPEDTTNTNKVDN